MFDFHVSLAFDVDTMCLKAVLSILSQLQGEINTLNSNSGRVNICYKSQLSGLENLSTTVSQLEF